MNAILLIIIAYIFLFGLKKRVKIFGLEIQFNYPGILTSDDK